MRVEKRGERINALSKMVPYFSLLELRRLHMLLRVNECGMALISEQTASALTRIKKRQKERASN